MSRSQLFITNAFVVILVAVGMVLIERRQDDRVHAEQVEACERVNANPREPLHDFLVAFVKDERQESDDTELLRAAIELRDATGSVPCEDEVDKPGVFGTLDGLAAER